NTQFDSIVEDDKEFVFTISGPDIESVSFKKSIHLQKGKNLINANLKVNNPHVWMTAGELKEAGLKENTIYNLNIKISDSDDKEINQPFCFSSLKAISKKDKVEGKTGRSIYFENNGRKIFAKGSNWIPADSLPSRMTENRYEDLLRSAVEANQNCIRVWGGGYYEKDYFYELCDKLGIMVWQDCMFACSLYPITTDFLENVTKEIEYQVNRLQSHACIAIWCGNNENFGTLNWFPESINNRDRYLVDYDRLYIDTIGRKIKDEDPSRIFWPSSPCAGPDDFADNWHADSMGDMHYWSVWHERKSFDAYLSIRPRFVSEFGYESFPSLETIKSFATEEDFNFTSKLMEYHQRSPSGNSIILENFSRYFRFPNGFESMIYLSQVQQALAIKTAVDWWRSLMPNCMGALIWQLNDVWPCPSWSSLEYNGKWKLLHYESRKFFDIVYMPLYIKEKKLYANICNETNDNLELQVNINYYKFDGSNFTKSKLIKKTVEAQSVTNVLEECVDEVNENEFFIYAT
ncbi:MAG: glycoside hydrolase family 2 protein, partial [Treponema sp.]|nr:glycoside hydrolase family 2 protein [Treponema sp.]